MKYKNNLVNFVEDIQKKINIDEIVLDYFISDNSFALVAIKKNDFKFFIRNFKSSEINLFSTRVKKSLDGMLGVKSFDTKAAYELNKLSKNEIITQKSCQSELADTNAMTRVRLNLFTIDKWRPSNLPRVLKVSLPINPRSRQSQN